MLISLLLPTRQRPTELTRLVTSALSTASAADDLQLVTYIDDDDPSYDDLKLPMAWTKVRGPRHHDGLVNLSTKWNHCWEKCDGDVLMHCGDDIVFRTHGWDDAVRDALNSHPGKIAFVWCDDGGGGNQAAFGTHGFIHRNWAQTVGRFVPPYFVSDYNDTWFNDVADLAQIQHYLPEYLTEHMHYVHGKADKDLNTIERLQRHEANNPRAIYESPPMVAQRRHEATLLAAVRDAS